MTTTTATPHEQPRRYTTCSQCRKLVRVQTVVVVDGKAWCAKCRRAADDEENRA